MNRQGTILILGVEWDPDEDCHPRKWDWTDLAGAEASSVIDYIDGYDRPVVIPDSEDTSTRIKNIMRQVDEDDAGWLGRFFPSERAEIGEEGGLGP